MKGLFWYEPGIRTGHHIGVSGLQMYHQDCLLSRLEAERLLQKTRFDFSGKRHVFCLGALCGFLLIFEPKLLVFKGAFVRPTGDFP